MGEAAVYLWTGSVAAVISLIVWILSSFGNGGENS